MKCGVCFAAAYQTWRRAVYLKEGRCLGSGRRRKRKKTGRGTKGKCGEYLYIYLYIHIHTYICMCILPLFLNTLGVGNRCVREIMQ